VAKESRPLLFARAGSLIKLKLRFEELTGAAEAEWRHMGFSWALCTHAAIAPISFPIL